MDESGLFLEHYLIMVLGRRVENAKEVKKASREQ